MKKAAIFGFILALVGIIIGIITSNWRLTLQICGSIGLICICSGGILSGAFVGADKNRLNYATQNDKARLNKIKIMKLLVVIALPNIVAAIVVYFVFNNR